MYELYTASTFNGQRVSVMLEELETEYQVHAVDLTKKEQRQPRFLAINPSGRIPVLVDHDPSFSNPLTLTQSVAIVQYLAEKTNRFIPSNAVEKAQMYEWMHFHATDIGSNLFSAYYLDKLCQPNYPDAADVLRDRIQELYRHFDQRLGEQEYLAGEVYTIADIITLPAALAQEQALAIYPNLTRWLQQLKTRPAVQSGMKVPN